MRWATGLLAATLASRVLAQGDAPSCPPGPDRVDIAVDADVSFDPTSRLYTYAYTVRSSSRSEQELERFEVDAMKPQDVRAPRGWDGTVAFDKGSVHWMAMELDPAIADVVTGDGSVPPSIANVKPGSSLRGFSFQSTNPPGRVEYRAYGYAPVQFEGGDDAWEEYSEELLENCPMGPRKGFVTGPLAPLTDLPGAPGVPTFTDVTATSFALRWAEPEGGAASYDLETSVVHGEQGYVQRDLPAPSHHEPNVSPNTTYVVRVRAVNAAGAAGPWSEASSVRTPKLPPEAPVMLSFSGVSNESLTIEWGGCDTARTFQVERAPDVNGAPGPWSVVATGLRRWSHYEACAPGSTAWYRVRGENEAGIGPYTSPASVRCLNDAPGPPTFADVSASSVTIRWRAPASGAASYAIERSMFPSGWWTVVAKGLTSTSYVRAERGAAFDSYRVVAFDEAGRATSHSPVRSPRVPEGAPTNVPAAPVYRRIDDRAVEVAWTFFGGARRFRLERARDVAGAPGPWVEIAGPVEVTP